MTGPAELPLYAFMGATASGKSSYALDFARQHHGAIISADSMQIYRDLPIGTAQPTPEEMQEIPHYLVAECELQEPFTVFEFIKRAEAAIAECFAGKDKIIGMNIEACKLGFDKMQAAL